MTKQAIISGSSGLVGRKLAKLLVEKNFNVVCLGRNNLTKSEIKNLFEFEANYIPIEMSDILTLPSQIGSTDWDFNSEGVFYHFAWSGDTKLTDGTLDQQLQNVSFSTDALKVAKKLGCNKFVSSGSLEETYAESFLDHTADTFKSTQTNYTIAKLTARDMLKITAYLEKIDFIHTRFSVPLDPLLEGKGYISSTLREIFQNRIFEEPKNKQLFDIIFLDDLANAFYQIGEKGKNKADYFIGTGKPITLNDYFRSYRDLLDGKDIIHRNYGSNDCSIFNTFPLENDTGYISNTNKFKLKGIKQH